MTVARRDGAKKAVSRDGLLEALRREAEDLQKALYSKAEQFMKSKIKEALSMEEARVQTQTGVALVPWCGSEECGHRLEDQVEANMLGKPQYQSFSEAACAVCGQKSTGRTYMARQY